MGEPLHHNADEALTWAGGVDEGRMRLADGTYKEAGVANLAKFNEAQSWLAEWIASARRGRASARHMIMTTAIEQRRNLEAVKHWGHSGWCDVAEYERGVRLIEEAARELSAQR